MKLKVIVLLLCLTALVFAQSSKMEDGQTATAVTGSQRINVENTPEEVSTILFPDVMQKPAGESAKAEAEREPRVRRREPVQMKPLWERLERIPNAEKENAILGFEYTRDLKQEDMLKVKEIENLWNQGFHEDAINRFRQLEEKIGLGHIDMGIQWKQPKPLGKTSWGTDSQVSSDQYPDICTLDLKHSTGHMFSVVLYPDGSYEDWSINRSTNAGATWNQTYSWNAGTFDVCVDVDAVVCGDWLYVAYIGGANQDEARLRRINISDGSVDNTYGYYSVVDIGETVWEVALASREDMGTHEFQYAAIVNDSLYFYFNQSMTTWTPGGPGFTGYEDVGWGLDACYNTNRTSWYFWASYYGTDDRFHIFARSGTAGNNMWTFSSVTDPNNWISSIGAYEDVIFSPFEYTYLTGAGLRYYISYDEGTNWLIGSSFVEPASGESFYAPDVTGRNNGGFAIAFAEEAGAFDPVWYTHRPYGTSTFTTPVSFNDYDCYSYGPPAIEWREGSDDYGVAYVGEYTYFDRLLYTSVDETNVSIPIDYALFQNYPNPFNPSTRIEFNLPVSSFVKLKIYNSLGQEVDRLIYGYKDAGTHQVTWQAEDVPAGIYLCKLEAGDYAQTIKLVLQK